MSMHTISLEYSIYRRNDIYRIKREPDWQRLWTVPQISLLYVLRGGDTPLDPNGASERQPLAGVSKSKPHCEDASLHIGLFLVTRA